MCISFYCDFLLNRDGSLYLHKTNLCCAKFVLKYLHTLKFRECSVINPIFVLTTYILQAFPLKLLIETSKRFIVIVKPFITPILIRHKATFNGP